VRVVDVSSTQQKKVSFGDLKKQRGQHLLIFDQCEALLKATAAQQRRWHAMFKNLLSTDIYVLFASRAPAKAYATSQVIPKQVLDNFVSSRVRFQPFFVTRS
jgi:hypothetical protein